MSNAKFDIPAAIAHQIRTGWRQGAATEAGAAADVGFLVPGLSDALPIAVLTDGFLIPPLPFLLSNRLQIVGESVLYPAAPLLLADLPPASLNLFENVHHANEALFPLCGQYAHYFWHWVTEFLPRVLVAKNAQFNGRYVVPKAAPRFIYESLELLGIAKDQTREAEPLQAQELWVPPAWTGTIGHGRLSFEELPELIRSLRERILASTAGRGDGGRSRIYISRAGAPRGRNIRNESELTAILQEHGFQTVVMESLTFSEQIQIVRNASILAGPHGAGMVHALFMPENAAIVEFLPKGFHPTTNHAFHKLLTQRYVFVEGRALSDQGYVHPNLADIDLDLDQVKAVLKKLEGAVHV